MTLEHSTSGEDGLVDRLLAWAHAAMNHPLSPDEARALLRAAAPPTTQAPVLGQCEFCGAFFNLAAEPCARCGAAWRTLCPLHRLTQSLGEQERLDEENADRRTQGLPPITAHFACSKLTVNGQERCPTCRCPKAAPTARERAAKRWGMGREGETKR